MKIQGKCDFFATHNLSSAQTSYTRDYKRLVTGANVDRRVRLSLDLFGPRGSGKSALALALCGLELGFVGPTNEGCILSGLYQNPRDNRRYSLQVSEWCDVQEASTGIGLVIPCGKEMPFDCFDHVIECVNPEQTVVIFITMCDVGNPTQFKEAVQFASKIMTALELHGSRSVIAPVCLAPQKVTRSSLGHVCSMLLQREEVRVVQRELLSVQQKEQKQLISETDYFKDVIWGSLARRGQVSDEFRDLLGEERLQRKQSPEDFAHKTVKGTTDTSPAALTVMLDLFQGPSGGPSTSEPGQELQMLKRDPRQRRAHQGETDEPVGELLLPQKEPDDLKAHSNMRITKEFLFSWASKKLGTVVPDHEYFRDVVGLVELFFAVFPEQVKEQLPLVEPQLMRETGPDQVRQNVSVLRYLLKSLLFPVEVFELEALESGKRKQTLGLLITLYFVEHVRSGSDEPLEFEVSITQRVCDFLQSQQLVQIATRADSVEQLLQEIDAASVIQSHNQKQEPSGEQDDFWANSQEEAAARRDAPAQAQQQPPVQVPQIPQQQPTQTKMQQQPQVYPKTSPAASKTALTKTDLFENEPARALSASRLSAPRPATRRVLYEQPQVSAPQAANPTLQPVQTQATPIQSHAVPAAQSQVQSSPAVVFQFLERQVNQCAERQQAIQQAISAAQGYQQRSKKLIDTLILNALPEIYQGSDADGWLEKLASLVAQSSGAEINQILEGLAQIASELRSDRAVLQDIQQQLQDAGVQAPQASTLGQLLTGLLKIIYVMSDRLFEAQKDSLRPAEIASVLNDQAKGFLRHQPGFYSERACLAKAEVVFASFQPELDYLAGLRAADIVPEYTELLHRLQDRQVDVELLQFLPEHLRSAAAVSLSQIDDPDLLRVQNQLTHQKLQLLADLCLMQHAEFTRRQEQYEDAVQHAARVVQNAQKVAFAEIEGLRAGIPEVSQMEQEMARLKAQTNYLRQELDDMNELLQEKTRLQSADQRNCQKLKREVMYLNQKDEYQRKIIEKQNQIIQKQKLGLAVQHEEAELKKHIAAQFSVQTGQFELDEPHEMAKQQQLSALDAKNQGLAEENQALAGKLAGLERSYELLEQNYLALKRFVEAQ